MYRLLQLSLTLEKAKIMIATCYILIASRQFSMLFLDHFAMFTVKAKTKPARMAFSRPNNIAIVIIPGQSRKIQTILSTVKTENFLHHYFEHKT